MIETLVACYILVLVLNYIFMREIYKRRPNDIDGPMLALAMTPILNVIVLLASMLTLFNICGKRITLDKIFFIKEEKE